MIASMSPKMRKKAEALLKSEDFYSLVCSDGIYEAEIISDNGCFLPQVMLDEDDCVWDYECKCVKGMGICVHLAAVLLGIEKMIQVDCNDYHEAVILIDLYESANVELREQGYNV